jgi:hypothetical protein
MDKIWRILRKTWLLVIAAVAAAVVWWISTYFIDELKKKEDNQVQGINNYQYLQNTEMSLEANVNVLENGCKVDTGADRVKKLCVAYGSQAQCLYAWIKQGETNRGSIENDPARDSTVAYTAVNEFRINNRQLDILKNEVRRLHDDMANLAPRFIEVGTARFRIWRVKREGWEWWRNALFIAAGILGAANSIILAFREYNAEQEKIKAAPTKPVTAVSRPGNKGKSKTKP